MDDIKYTVPNQKVITINKDEKIDAKKGAFLVIYEDTLVRASHDLKGNAFKLYLYLLANKNGYKFAYSPQAVAECMGISIDSVREQWKILMEKRYVLEVDHLRYNFYDLPHLLEEDKEGVRYFIYNGKERAMTYEQVYNDYYMGNRDDEKTSYYWLRGSITPTQTEGE